MANVEVKIGNTTLPGDIITMKRSDELFWSEGTGRSASTGRLSGSIVARKMTYTFEWGPITQAQYDAIRTAADSATFMTLSVKVNGSTVASTTVYRSNVAGDLMQVAGGTTYYKNVSVQFVEV